jgi:hypothetical protein
METGGVYTPTAFIQIKRNKFKYKLPSRESTKRTKGE